MNSGAALALLFERGRLTRGELRAATGLSKPTVSEVMRRLVAADLAIVDGFIRGGPGPSTEVYAVNPDAAHVAAVSVRENPDGPWLTAARADLTGTIRATLDRPVDLRAGGAIAAVAAAIEELGFSVRSGSGTVAAGATSGAVGTSTVVGVGPLAQVCLGLPGAFDPVRRVIHHIDLPGFDAVGLVDALADRLGVPVDLENDVNLATVAERNRGCARDASGFALLWLGEGVGLGIDLAGTLLRGARGGAGELGYLPLTPPAPPGTPGPGAPGGGPPDARPAGAEPARPDRLQELVGGAAVRALAAQYVAARSGTATVDSTVDVIVAATTDPRFLVAFADRVAYSLAAVVAVLDPELVVLAGPVGRVAGAPLGEAVVAALGRITPLDPAVAPIAVSVTTVDGDPVVAGGLDAALRAARQRQFATLHDPNQ
jgi:predicted NBD/HSP70 family sugar kinase